MPHFSASSISKLATCDDRLKKLMQAVIQEIDIVIVCGHRGRVEQEKAFETGMSKAHWMESPHNFYPSRAVDIAPYDAANKSIPWDDNAAFEKMAALVLRKAEALGIHVTWGGHFKSIVDLPHFELRDWDEKRIANHNP